MARLRARDRTVAMRLAPRKQESELLDPNIVCAQIDAKLFGRLRLLSLEARVVAGKPTETAAPAANGVAPVTNRKTARLNRESSKPDSDSDLGRAVELWTLGSEVLEAIRAQQT